MMDRPSVWPAEEQAVGDVAVAEGGALDLQHPEVGRKLRCSPLIEGEHSTRSFRLPIRGLCFPRRDDAGLEHGEGAGRKVEALDRRRRR
jgi:hypothetical protein